MKIIPSAVRADKEVTYKFNNEHIQATVDENELLFDLSNVEEGKQYEPVSPIVNVKRDTDGKLEVTLTVYHGANATHEEWFPEPYMAKNTSLRNDLDVITLKEVEEPEINNIPSTEERLEVIESYMIESLLGG